MRPITHCAKKHDDFKKKSRMEEDTLVIRGKRYNVNNLHQLPIKINGFDGNHQKGGGNNMFLWRTKPHVKFSPREN